jgi:hypothetical protein
VLRRWRETQDGSIVAAVPWTPLGQGLVGVVAVDGDILTVGERGALIRLAVDVPSAPRPTARAGLAENLPGNILRDVAVGADVVWLLTLDDRLVPLPLDAQGLVSGDRLGADLGADGASQVAAFGARAVVAFADGLGVYERAPDGRPVEIGRVSWSSDAGSAVDLEVMDGHAWIASRTGRPGVRVVDLRDPARPEVVAELRGDGIEALAVGDGGVYLLSVGALDGRQLLQVLDASRPASPRSLGQIDLPPLSGGRLLVAGGLVFVAREGDLRVIDVRLPSQPDEIAWHALPGQPRGLAMVDGVLWLADAELGLVAFVVGGPTVARLSLPWLGR